MTIARWLFGYGSIIWKTGFDYDESCLVFVKDRSRRFWQGSIDHRGTVKAPGRVATLINMPGATCWGLAFKLSRSSIYSTISMLDDREIGGYQREKITIHFPNDKSVEGITYTAHPDNPHYLGEASLAETVKQIAACRGPSGSNAEYVLELATALDNLNIKDLYVTTLAELLKKEQKTKRIS